MSTLLTRGIHHISIKCEGEGELERALGFYRDLLGMSVVRRWGEGEAAGAMLDTGSGMIEVFANSKGVLPQGAIRHIALTTDDVDACVKAVSDAGYTILVQPTDITIPSEPPFHARMAFCLGPVGEQIEFFQETADIL